MENIFSVILVGDSHAQSVKSAINHHQLNRYPDLSLLAFKYAVVKNGRLGGDLPESEILSRVQGLAPPAFVFSAIGGNQHHIISLVRHSRDFDFHSEFQLDAKCGAEIIPQSQIKSLILHFMSKDLRKLERLRASTNLEIFHLCAPPPKADEAFILKHAGLTFKRAGIDSFGINPASFRLKVWRLQCEVLRESLERLNIRLVPPPIDGITPEGFLDPAFYADDATHANLDYGVLLVRQISEIVRGSSVAAGHH